MNQTKKEIGVYILSIIIITNILWYVGYQMRMANETSIGALLFTALAAFMPAIIALIMCLHTKTKFRTMLLPPNIKKSWKVYILAIALSLFLVYASDLLPLLFFPDDVSVVAENLTIMYIGKIVLFTVISTIESIELLGEELGWMGYLYPRLEKEYGTFPGTLIVSVVRTLYHVAALILIAGSVSASIQAVVYLFINNFFLQSILVYVTKKSHSVFPAAVIHAITNILPILTFVSFREGFDESIPFRIVGSIPVIIIGTIFYILLFKDNRNAQCDSGLRGGSERDEDQHIDG